MRNKINLPFLSVDYGDMTVDFFGIQNNDSPVAFTRIIDNWVVESHFHIDYELHYILKGCVCLNTDEYEIEVNEGSFCLIPPHVIHFADNRRDIRRLSVGFRIRSNKHQNSGTQSEYSYYTDNFNKIKTAFCYKHNQFIALCCDKLDYYSSMTGFLPEIHISAVMRTLFIETADIIVNSVQKMEKHNIVQQVSGSSANNNTLNVNLRRCMIIDSFVAEHYSQEAKYDILAQLLCLSRIQCIRVVNKLTGETLGSLIKRQRMNIARQLMEAGHMSLTEIADYVGYSSYSGFFVTYKNYYNVSPGKSAVKVK
ncbi:MAG: AraC family transcriptional regulator [Eubacteriales bacterium]